MIGGANHRLFGVLSTELEKPKRSKDPRFATNSARVANRVLVEDWIESINKKYKTQHWLETFEGTGLTYEEVNDLLDTVDHEHGKSLFSVQAAD